MHSWGSILRFAFGLPRDATRSARRGFRAASEKMRQRLEQIGATFVEGYHATLQHGTSPALTRELNAIESELRGFAFEGAAMGLAFLDRLTPWGGSRIPQFLQGPGDAHAYMVHVGVGWLWARLPFGLRRAQRRLDPLLVWLAFDGWGFHEGYFHWPSYVAGKPAPRCLKGYARRAFDQGLGRSFWFVNGGNPALIARTLADLPRERRPDLWSGVGLAATYAGLVDEAQLRELRDAAGPFAAQLAQGAAFAAKARERAGNLTDYTTLATGVLCELSTSDAAHLCDVMMKDLPKESAIQAYEIWRQRIQDHFAPHRGHAIPQLSKGFPSASVR